ncbi:MAG: hypothetical protein U0836_26970 [Pirellulales bacterium]
MSDEPLVTMQEAADLLGITVDELRQLHGERLFKLLAKTDRPGAHFRRADILALPANFEPSEPWTPESDDPHGNSSELVEA